MREQIESELVYLPEVAKILRRNPDTVRRWAATGAVLPPARMIGSRKAWLRAEIEGLVNTGSEPTWRHPGRPGRPSRYAALAANHAADFRAQRRTSR